jgi:adenosine/AMP kinase
MATIQITMVGVETAFEIADADAARILQAYTAIYTTTDEDGQPVVPTPEQCVHMIAQGVVDGLAANTVQYDKVQASANASANVPPIDIVVVPTQVA